MTVGNRGLRRMVRKLERKKRRLRRHFLDHWPVCKCEVCASAGERFRRHKQISGRIWLLECIARERGLDLWAHRPFPF